MIGRARARTSLLLTLLMAACVGGEQEEQPTDTATMGGAAAVALDPDTTEHALWEHLQEESYRDWQLWPGKGEMYEGGEPHGMLLTTYVNQLAFDALTSGSALMPAGAIIVKENYMPDGTLAAITTMYKVPGYNMAANDWFWAKHDAQGVAEASGRVDGCITCHTTRMPQDYLMTLRPGETPDEGG